MVIRSYLQGTGTCANSVGKVQFLNNCLTISFQNVNLYSAFKSAYILNKEHRKNYSFRSGKISCNIKYKHINKTFYKNRRYRLQLKVTADDLTDFAVVVKAP